MKAMKRFVFALLACASVGAYAAQDIQIDAANIQLWSNINGDNRIRLMAPTVVNAWGCTDPDSYYVMSTIPQAAQSRIFATILTAKAMNRAVIIRVDGCEDGRPRILNAYF